MSVYWCRQVWSSSRQQSQSDRTSEWTRHLRLLTTIWMKVTILIRISDISRQELDIWYLYFTSHKAFGDSAAAVYLVCSRFLHLRSFANPQNPASYFADRQPTKRRATNHLKTFFWQILVKTSFCGEWNLEFGSNTTDKFEISRGEAEWNFKFFCGVWKPNSKFHSPQKDVYY